MQALTAISPLLAHPLPWVIVGGVFVGAALSRATTRTANRRDPERARARKWILACVFLSVGVIMGLIAVFIPGSAKILDIRLLWSAGIAAAVAFAALRFKKAVGLPVIAMLTAAIIVFGLFLQSLRAFTGETEIAAIRVIEAGAGSMRLELVPRGEPTVLLTMGGEYLAPIVKVVIFDDFFVFLGARTWYRFEGMTSFDRNLRQQDTDYRLPRPLGISERLWAFFEANEAIIPGVKTAQIEIVMKKAKEFADYSIRVQNDGGVQIVPSSS